MKFSELRSRLQLHSVYPNQRIALWLRAHIRSDSYEGITTSGRYGKGISLPGCSQRRLFGVNKNLVSGNRTTTIISALQWIRETNLHLVRNALLIGAHISGNSVFLAGANFDPTDIGQQGGMLQDITDLEEVEGSGRCLARSQFDPKTVLTIPRLPRLNLPVETGQTADPAGSLTQGRPALWAAFKTGVGQQIPAVEPLNRIVIFEERLIHRNDFHFIEPQRACRVKVEQQLRITVTDETCLKISLVILPMFSESELIKQQRRFPVVALLGGGLQLTGYHGRGHSFLASPAGKAIPLSLSQAYSPVLR